MATPTTKPKQDEPIINLDEGDENADWIKLLGGGRARLKELAIHRQLAEKFKENDAPKKD